MKEKSNMPINFIKCTISELTTSTTDFVDWNGTRLYN